MSEEYKNYQAIAADYGEKLNSADCSGSTSTEGGMHLSSFRNFLTGTFYSGPHASYWVRDWLADGTANNFLFGFLSKGKCANFIALIDHVCKTGLMENGKDGQEEGAQAPVKRKTFFDKIKNAQNEEVLLKVFIDYFNKIKEENEDTDQSLFIKKIDMFAKQHNLSDSLGEDFKKEIKRLVDPHSTSNKRFARIGAFFGGLAEGFINYSAVTTGVGFVSALSAGWVMAIGAVVFFAGFYIHNRLYKHDLYNASRDFWLDRWLKKKNKDGAYEALPRLEYSLVLLVGLLALMSALCGLALTLTSISTVLTGSVSYFGLTIASPFAICGICSMATVSLFGIVNFIKNGRENGEAAKAYFNETCFNKNGSYNIFQIAFECIKALLVFATIAIIASVSFFLFQGKLVDVMTKWKVCTAAVAQVAATVLSGINSGLKLFFGSINLFKLTHAITSWFQKEKVAPFELNPIQKSQASAEFLENCLNAPLLSINAITKVAIYYKPTLELISPVTSILNIPIDNIMRETISIVGPGCEGPYVLGFSTIGIENAKTNPVACVSKAGIFKQPGNSRPNVESSDAASLLSFVECKS